MMTTAETKTATTTNLQPNFHGDANQARLQAVTNPNIKNPLTFTDPVDRQAAILARAQRIMNNPKYQSLSPGHQKKVREDYYTKYVAPGYAKANFPIPDKDTWVEEVTKHGFKPEDYYQSTNARQAANLIAGAESSAGSILQGSLSAGMWISRQATLAQLGLLHYFRNSTQTEADRDGKFAGEGANFAQRAVNKISLDTIHSANFWLQTHPSSTMVEKADSFVGENIMQLGLYEGLGAAKALITPGNLTKSLAVGGKTARIVAEGLNSASDAFMGDLIQGKSKEDTASDMAMFMGFGAGSKALSIAGSAMMKKFIANIAMHGGKPLAEAASSEAIHEIETGKIHGHAAPETESPIEKSKTRLYHKGQTGRYDGPAWFSSDKKYAENYRKDGELQYVDYPTDKLEDQGSNTFLGELHSDVTGARKPVKFSINVSSAQVQTAISNAIKDDPIKAKIVTSYKAIIQSISKSNFGKGYKDLTAEQKATVRAFHKDLTQSAINEMPLHVPEVAKANATAAIQSAHEADPEMAKWDAAMMQKYQIQPDQVLHEAEQEMTAKQTGVKSVQGATKKTSKATERVNQVIAERLAGATKNEKNRYASFKVNHLAYFKNPAGKAKFDYGSWLEGMDSKDFISELKDHIGNDWYFESPQHLLEYGLQYSMEMPKEFKSRILEELHDLDPTGTQQGWLVAGNNRDKHLEHMAVTGRLFDERNIYRSSRFGYGEKPTKWQKQLAREAKAITQNEKKQLSAKMKPMRGNYKQANDIAQAALSSMQRHWSEGTIIDAKEDLGNILPNARKSDE